MMLGVGILFGGCGPNTNTDVTAVPTGGNILVSPSSVPTERGALPAPEVTAATSTLPANGTPAPPAPTNAAYPLPGADAQNQAIMEANNGQKITLKVGSTLLVELHERKWSMPVVDAKILVVAPLNIAVPQGASAWKYKAVAPGQTTLTTDGACEAYPTGGVTCASIVVYKVSVVVTN
jgi:hypothetical protein